MRFLFFVVLNFFVSPSFAQNLTGQWKGGFVDTRIADNTFGGDRCDYVLDLDVRGKTISGYSYTYFTDGGKKYYTICRLKGFANLKKKYIEVTETERTKTNVPDNISNSFQVHKLKWKKEGINEILEGSWEPAPGQGSGSAGFGTTKLAKRRLSDIAPLAKKTTLSKETISPRNKPVPALTVVKRYPVQNKNLTDIAKARPKKRLPVMAITPVKAIPKTSSAAKKDSVKKDIDLAIINLPLQKFLPASYEKRNNALMQTINAENATVIIELYDNGDIDGDSISLFYNGKLLLAHKKLTENPIVLELSVADEEENELVMYADNLGTLPPNTGLMIVRDGHKRYEVRITSDLKKSGTIKFIHKK